MNLRRVLYAAVAGAVLLVSGAAFSGGQTTSVNELMDFDRATGKLWAYPKGKALTIYVHTIHTEHLAAELAHFLPPDPCLPIARAWNFTVAFDEVNHVRSTLVFEALLGLMTDFQCKATVTNTDGVPKPIVRIAPTAK